MFEFFEVIRRKLMSLRKKSEILIITNILTRISERMSCEDSAIFFTNSASIPHIKQKYSTQSNEIKLPPQAILAFKILGIFSVEN